MTSPEHEQNGATIEPQPVDVPLEPTPGERYPAPGDGNYTRDGEAWYPGGADHDAARAADEQAAVQPLDEQADETSGQDV